MKSLVWFRLTRFNNTFYLLTVLLAIVCLIQIYYKGGIGKMVSSSNCHSNNCQPQTLVYTTTNKTPATPRTYSYESVDVSLSNFTDNTIFAFDAYLLTNNEIRIMTVRKCKNNKNISLQLNYNGSTEIVSIRSYPINNCPWFFAPKKVIMCHLVGYFSVALFSNAAIINGIRQNQLPEMYIGETKSVMVKKQRRVQLERPQRLNVIDVRLGSLVGRHTLAVCLQPIFFFADWTLLVQFFETWITQGATKFYIYVQSMAPEVEELLQVYESDPDIDVERVHWAPLPRQASGFEPNNYVYRGEVVASVNDCILRARGQAKLVVSSDLDEIVFAHGQPLLSLLEMLIVKYPKAAAFLFRTRMAAFQNQWANITNPSDIDFEMLGNITVDKKIWPIGQRSKLIMIPELIGRTHVHSVLSIERGHSMINVDPRTGIVLHLRRVYLKGTYSDSADYLKPLIPLYNKQWRKRQNLINKLTNTVILKGDQWPNRGLQVLKEIDECRNEMESLKKVTCISYFKCFGNITAVEPNEWIWADQHWIAL